MMVSIITLFLSVAVVTQTLQKAGKEDPLKLCHCITPPPRLVLGELIMCITSLLIDPIQIKIKQYLNRKYSLNVLSMTPILKNWNVV